MSLLGLLDQVPLEVARPVATLILGIIRIVRAGDSAEARWDALAATQEALKAELDNQRFGPPTTR